MTLELMQPLFGQDDWRYLERIILLEVNPSEAADIWSCEPTFSLIMSCSIWIAFAASSSFETYFPRSTARA